MKKWVYHIIVCVMILAVMPAVSAKVIANLYQAQIPVASQSTTERDQAIIGSFQQVLVKVSGNSQIIKNATVAQASANASNYMQQYSYVRVPLFGLPVTAGSAPQPSQLAIQAVFDSEQIKQLLQSINQPLWGRERPVVLLWAAVSNSGASQLLSAGTPDPAVLMLQQLFIQRGLPLVLPNSTQTPDLQQNLTVVVNDILQSNGDDLKKYSQPYKANAIVNLQLTQSNDQWSGQWILWINGEQLTGQALGADVWTVLQQVTDQVSDAVAQRYVVQNQAQKNTITMTITNLGNLDNYVKARTYLKQLTPVQQVEVVEITPNAVQFKLSYDGSQNDLLSAINLGAKLMPIQSNDADPASTINYQWQPNS